MEKQHGLSKALLAFKDTQRHVQVKESKEEAEHFVRQGPSAKTKLRIITAVIAAASVTFISVYRYLIESADI